MAHLLVLSLCCVIPVIAVAVGIWTVQRSRERR
jgi:uncharacterized membrane protein YqjE